MFKVDKTDYSIILTRGDRVFLRVKAKRHGKQYTFVKGDIVRITVSERKNVSNVVLKKDVLVKNDTDAVKIILEEHETRIGEEISKPKVYWYEIELNPDTNPCTIIGYDDNGPKTFTLYPEMSKSKNNEGGN